MPDIEGLQAIANLNQTYQKNQDQRAQSSRREDVIPQAAQLFQQGDVKGAYRALAAADPEWAMSLAKNMNPGSKILKTQNIQLDNGSIIPANVGTDGSYYWPGTQEAIAPTMIRGTGFAPQGYFNPTTGERQTSLGATGDVRDITGPKAGKMTTMGSGNPYQPKAAIGAPGLANPSTPIQQSIQQPTQPMGSGMPTGSQAPVPTATPKPQVDPMEAEAKRSFQSLNPKMRGFYQDQQKSFMNEVEKDRAGVQAAGRITDLLKAGKSLDGDVMRAFQNQFARASSEVGVMTDQDVAGYGGKSGALARLNRLVSMNLTDKIPESDRQFLLGLSRVLKTTGEKIINNKAEAYTNQIAAQTSLTTDQARHLLTKGVSGEQKMIRVQTPDGQVGSIPEASLKDALKRGFKQVQ